MEWAPKQAEIGKKRLKTSMLFPWVPLVPLWCLSLRREHLFSTITVLLIDDSTAKSGHLMIGIRKVKPVLGLNAQLALFPSGYETYQEIQPSNLWALISLYSGLVGLSGADGW